MRWDQAIVRFHEKLEMNFNAEDTFGLYQVTAILDLVRELSLLQKGHIVLVKPSTPYGKLFYERSMLLAQMIKQEKRALHITVIDEDVEPSVFPKGVLYTYRRLYKQQIHYRPKEHIKIHDQTAKRLTLRSGKTVHYDLLMEYPTLPYEMDLNNRYHRGVNAVRLLWGKKPIAKPYRPFMLVDYAPYSGLNGFAKRFKRTTAISGLKAQMDLLKQLY